MRLFCWPLSDFSFPHFYFNRLKKLGLFLPDWKRKNLCKKIQISTGKGIICPVDSFLDFLLVQLTSACIFDNTFTEIFSKGNRRFCEVVILFCSLKCLTANGHSFLGVSFCFDIFRCSYRPNIFAEHAFELGIKTSILSFSAYWCFLTNAEKN